MLTKVDSVVLKCLLNLSKGRRSFLTTAEEVTKNTKSNLQKFDIEKSISDLSFDGYFDLTPADRKGDKVYCITLSNKGIGYGRSVKQFKRGIFFRVAFTIALAFISFAVGIILKAIF